MSEEYLDELLKSIEKKETSNHTALSKLHGEKEIEQPENTELESIPVESPVVEEILPDELLEPQELDLDADELSAMEELMQGDGVPDLDELLKMDDLPNLDGLLPVEEFPESDAIPDEVLEDDRLPLEELLSPMEDELPLEELLSPAEENFEDDPLKSLLADMELETEENEDFGMSEAEIEALLNAAKENTEIEPLPEEDITLTEADGDLAEIQELLEKSDSNEAVDESIFEPIEEMSSLPLEEMSGENGFAGDIEALLAEEGVAEETPKKERKERKKKEKPVKKEKPKKEKQKKENGLFSKIFSMLMEEVPEENLPEEAGQVPISSENMEILSELDKEGKKKSKAAEKKAKKEQKEKEKKEKPKKEKPKKEKKAKPKKEKPEKVVEPEEPKKSLPKKGIVVVFLFAFSCLAVILLVETQFSKVVVLGMARNSYDKGEYKEAYDAYYGYELPEEDEVRFQGATTILRVERKIDSYHNYNSLGQGLLALNALFEAVGMNEEIYLKAETYGVVPQVDGLYEQIYEILNQDYNLSKEQVEEINAEESNVTYTRKLEAIVGGTEYIETEINEIPQEDLLPEEEQIFAGQETPEELPEETTEEEPDTTEGEVVVVGSRK